MKLKAGHGLDSNGYIVSDVSLEKIPLLYMPCIEEAIERLRHLFPQQLHSVYLYGSVARGDAVPVTSDLDLIAMFKGQLNSLELARLKNLAKALSREYVHLVRDVGIAIAYYEYTMDPSNYDENAFLKELSVCVFGQDLGEQFGPYKLSAEIAIRFNGDIGESLARTQKRLETASNQDVMNISQGFARKLIRTYYSMVMLRSQIWTTRLHEQADVAIHYFPAKELPIRTFLNWVGNPPTDREAVYELVKKEGEWASANFMREAQKSS